MIEAILNNKSFSSNAINSIVKQDLNVLNFQTVVNPFSKVETTRNKLSISVETDTGSLNPLLKVHP